MRISATVLVHVGGIAGKQQAVAWTGTEEVNSLQDAGFESSAGPSWIDCVLLGRKRRTDYLDINEYIWLIIVVMQHVETYR